MSHHKLRGNKKCLNCGYLVRKRYCPKCGQENIETRQSFHYLFTHFIEDLVHYDGSFWKTLKAILFKPGELTKEYLQGKRKKYVPPVKLYIFVSFFVFFVGGLVSKLTSNIEGIAQEDNTITYGVLHIASPEEVNDSINRLENQNIRKIANLKEYDSIQLTLPLDERDTGIAKIMNRKLAENQDKYSERDFLSKMIEAFKANFQKFLF